MKKALGIDVGGTGIKGAIIDLDTGQLLTERIKIKTIHPATPKSVGKQVLELRDLLGYDGKTVGIGFPAVIKNGKSLSAANIDDRWINYPIVQYFTDLFGHKVTVINDADAAGLAEFNYEDSISKSGMTIFLTIGTGIGSALFYNGILVPNTEFGHFSFKNKIAEKLVSNHAREKFDLSWSKWGKELNEYLCLVCTVMRPNAIILGGGVSKKFEKYSKYLDVPAEIKTATLLNEAGVIGAALAAYQNIDS